ncbi:quattro isoform X1 [Nothobranchius furzeri]|uniref:Quattro n=2 Tax=Nothobranchius TaxID=28779 RepID=A0A1A8ALE6_NOTFU
MNPESLELSIQSALSALFPPFEATAPIVLSQLFRTIDERYHGDALQCLLDFLIPSKHLLESVQQAACAGYSDVVFRCEGWPLCLHDKTVIQLASVNPLLLRPGDFYLQVEPFGDQAARIVLKTLLEEGCREVEETPVPETSYPVLFTEDWLQDINKGRQGTSLSRCLLSTDQGVIKLPWDKITIPEFLDKPKIMLRCVEAPSEPRRVSASSHFNSSTLPVEAWVPPSEVRISASLRPAHSSSKLIKIENERQTPRSAPKPLIKPVGWVSPNTWESLNSREMEGDYVDLVEIAKGKEFLDNRINPPNPVLVKPVRPPPPIPLGNSAPCGRSLWCTGESCTPCNQRTLELELTDQDLKCRYRDSYLAALKNPVQFEKGNVDLLSALEEVRLCEDGVERGTFETRTEEHMDNHSKERSQLSGVVCQINSSSESKNLTKDSPLVLKSCLSQSSNLFPTVLISEQARHAACVHPVSDMSLAPCDGDVKPHQIVKPSGKHKVKVRSLSTVSETPKGSPALYKLNNRSQSDVCPQAITSIIQHEKREVDQVEGQRHFRKADSSRGEPPASTNGPESKMSENQFSPHVQLPATNSGCQQPPQTKESGSRKIRSLLELGIICLPGSRDRNGRAVVEVHGDRKEWMSPLVTAHNVCELLLYLHSLPRREVRELGLTLVINARKKPVPVHLYRALLMVQEQTLHTVHSIIMLKDKDNCPRPEKHPGLQIDMATSVRALNKTVEASQLTSDLGGTFMYSHFHWLQFHQKLVSFMADLRGANSLLHNAIKKVDSRKQMHAAQEVQESIQEQRVLMKEVLEDAGLVTLQKEGGTLLARMKKEEFRFSQSEDYRDALESMTDLYNQVEEKLHMLVMRSNESLQQLEFLHKLRETEAKIISVGTWFSSEGEQSLKNCETIDDTQVGTEKILQDFNLLLSHSKEKQQLALSLVTEAGEIVQNGDSSPAADVFQTLVGTFKSNVEDFMLRVEQRKKDLEPLMQIYSFCEQASAFTEECSRFLEQVEDGCLSVQTLTTIQMYEEKLDREFSPRCFQALKAKARAMGAGASGMMRMWNVAWNQSQGVKQRFEEMQEKKKSIDKKQIQPTTAATPLGEHSGSEREGERNEPGEAESSLIVQSVSPKETDNSAGDSKERMHGACSELKFETTIKGKEKEVPKAHPSPETKPKNETGTLIVPEQDDWRPECKHRPREHHSEADLSSSVKEGEGFPSHQHLGRSLSDGSCVRRFSGCSPLSTSHKHCHSKKHSLDQNLPPTKILHMYRNESLWPGNLNCESKQDGDEVEGEGCVAPTQRSKELRSSKSLLIPTENNGGNVLKVLKIWEELLSTEREYVKALGYVREHYFPELERTDVPQDLRGQRGSVFGNLEKLHDFHRHHFLDELEACVHEPFRVGHCFLRHRESFALYALYSKNKPQSDRLLISHGKKFFKEKQLKLEDKMDLWSYLLKPVQRISKYSLLLQDVMRECGPDQTREISEINAALEVIHFQLRHGNNLLAMDAICNCDVNLKEQGQLRCQDEFLVTFRKKKCFRHIFLFQELILFSKTRKTDVGNDTYVYKQSFKTSDIGMTQNSGDSGLCFEIWFRKRKSQDTYTLQAVSREVKEAWTKELERLLWEQAIHNREIRMQERVFLGIGNKPFMDIQPSEAAISDRAVNYVLVGRENKVFPSVRSYRSQGELPGSDPQSVGSGSSSSSSYSSGRGSLSPVGYSCEAERRAVLAGLPGYVALPGALEEDDSNHEGGNQNLLLDSSESSGESVSGFSSSCHSYQSAMGEVDDSSSVCASIITVREVGAAQSTEATAVFPKQDALPGCAVENQPPLTTHIFF